MIRKPSNEELEGMTVNERLFASDLLGKYLDSERKRDRAGMVSILTQVAFTRKEACEIADNILQHPQRFESSP
jgi:hypothetical protein